MGRSKKLKSIYKRSYCVILWVHNLSKRTQHSNAILQRKSERHNDEEQKIHSSRYR